MDAFLRHMIGWGLLTLGAIFSWFAEITGVFVLFSLFFVADFVTGFIASNCRFSSSKARWSFAKALVYFGTFMFTIVIGVLLNERKFFEHVFRVAVWGATWFELVSNFENLKIIFPNNRFVNFIYFIISVEWVKKVPGLSDFLKQEKEKPID